MNWVIEWRQATLSNHFSETNIEWLRDAIRTHLALLLSGGYQFLPQHKEELSVSGDGVYYSDLDWQTLKTPQIVTILLEVAEFLYRNGDLIWNTWLVEQLINLPDEYKREFTPIDLKNSDMFGKMPLDLSVFCLSKAFLLLRAKLEWWRQTWLFHWLLLKTCLMLHRQQVSPQFVLWEEYGALDWLQFTRRYLVPDGNNEKGIHINIDWIQKYPKLWEEIEKLYALGFMASVEVDQTSFTQSPPLA